MSSDSGSVIQNGSTYETGSAASSPGRFFVLEGIDGSGKTTLAKRLAEILRSRTGREVILTREPTSSWLGDAVRRANAEDLNPLIETFLFLADRAGHNERISRWLETGAIVICDRYNGSTIAYQGAALEPMMGEGVAWLRSIAEPVVVHPDLTILLDIDPDLSLDRLVGREGRTKFESARYLGKVRRIYLHLAEDEGWRVIDASMPLESVLEEAISALIRNL